MFVNKKISSAIRISEFHSLAIYAPRDKSNMWIPSEKNKLGFSVTISAQNYQNRVSVEN